MVIDTEFPEGLSKYIIVGGAGDIVYENPEGVPQFVPGLIAGAYLPIVAKRIVASATVRGTPRTTTATNMGWLGGY